MSELIRPNAAVGQTGELIKLPQTPVAVAPPSGMMVNTDLPEYMQGEDTGTELMGQYVSPPRVSIVQAMSSAELKKTLGEGAIYSSAGNVLIAPPTGSVQFVPLFFYPEFIEWNPRNSKTAIRSRTFDSQSPLAARCRSFDKKVREYPCPEIPDKMIRCQEHLNFIIMLLNHDLTGIPMMLSFSRTAFRDGRQFIELLRMRKAPMYGLIFDMSTGGTGEYNRHNDEGDWFGFDIQPTIVAETGMCAYVDAEWFAYLKQQHEESRANYEAGLLAADYGDENADNASAPAEAGTDIKRF